MFDSTGSLDFPLALLRYMYLGCLYSSQLLGECLVPQSKEAVYAGLARSLALNAFRLRVSFSLVLSLGSREAARIVLPLVRRSLRAWDFAFLPSIHFGAVKDAYL